MLKPKGVPDPSFSVPTHLDSVLTSLEFLVGKNCFLMMYMSNNAIDMKFMADNSNNIVRLHI